MILQSNMNTATTLFPLRPRKWYYDRNTSERNKHNIIIWRIWMILYRRIRIPFPKAQT